MERKRISMVLAAAVLSTALTACGGSSSTGDQSSADAKAADAGSGGATLKWAVWDIAKTPYYQPLIDAFEKEHPEVKVELVDLGSSDYMTVLATQLSGSGSDFDVVTIKDVPGYATLVNKGVLEPLDERIAKDNIDLTMYGGLSDQVKVSGKLYELPFRSDRWVIYYNKDIFDKAGVPYPGNDMTWKEYDELARRLTDTTAGQEVYGAHYHTWRSTVQLDGILDGEHSIVDGSYDFTKPYYDMVLAEQKDGVCMDYATLKTQNLHYSDAFAQGNVAMMNMGSWFISTLIEKVKSGEYSSCANWGMVKYPHAEGAEPGSTLATITALGVPVSAPHKDLAWEFVKFVSGEKGAKIMAASGNIPAATDETIVDLIAGMEGFPKDDTSRDALIVTHAYLEMPVNEKSSEIEAALNEGHDLIMTESVTIDEGIKQMNEAVQAVLK